MAESSLLIGAQQVWPLTCALYLPKEWLSEPERGADVGIPASTRFREKWRIALDLLDRTIANGVSFRYLTADEEYGRSGPFRRGVAVHGIQYVVEVPCSMTGWTRQPPMRGLRPHAGTTFGQLRNAFRPVHRPLRSCSMSRGLRAGFRRSFTTWV